MDLEQRLALNVYAPEQLIAGEALHLLHGLQEVKFKELHAKYHFMLTEDMILQVVNSMCYYATFSSEQRVPEIIPWLLHARDWDLSLLSKILEKIPFNHPVAVCIYEWIVAREPQILLTTEHARVLFNAALHAEDWPNALTLITNPHFQPNHDKLILLAEEVLRHEQPDLFRLLLAHPNFNQYSRITLFNEKKWQDVGALSVKQWNIIREICNRDYRHAILNTESLHLVARDFNNLALFQSMLEDYAPRLDWESCKLLCQLINSAYFADEQDRPRFLPFITYLLNPLAPHAATFIDVIIPQFELSQDRLNHYYFLVHCIHSQAQIKLFSPKVIGWLAFHHDGRFHPLSRQAYPPKLESAIALAYVLLLAAEYLQQVIFDGSPGRFVHVVSRLPTELQLLVVNIAFQDKSCITTYQHLSKVITYVLQKQVDPWRTSRIPLLIACEVIRSDLLDCPLRNYEAPYLEINY